MSGSLRALWGWFRWEAGRLGLVALAFLAVDVPVLNWLGGPHMALQSHALFSVALALLLGSLAAGSGVAEANLEFLLARRLSRNAIWIVSTATGLGLALAFVLVEPLLSGPLGMTPELRATPDRVHPADLLPLCAALFLMASAVATLTRRPVTAIPIAIVLLAIIVLAALGLAADVTPGSWWESWGGSGTWMEGVARAALAAAAIAGASVSWAGLVLFGDPMEHRRRYLPLGGAGLLVLALLLAAAFDAGTTSPVEAAIELEREGGVRLLSSGNRTESWVAVEFPWPVWIGALQERFARAAPGSPAQLRLAIGLARAGDERGLELCAQRIRELARSEDVPDVADVAALHVVTLAGPDRDTAEALFACAHQASARILPRATGGPIRLSATDAAEVFLCELVWYTGQADRVRAAAMWMPLFEALAASGSWEALTRLT